MLLMTLSVIVLSASAYTIDSSCDAFNDLPGAIQEAIDMANYGKWRIDQATPAVGKVTNQLLGTNPVNLFKDRMQEAVNALGPHNGRWNVNNPPVDTSVVVKCGNAFLHYDQSDSSWKDPDFSQTMEGLLPYSGTPATTRPCSQASGEMARTYLTGLDDGRSPRFVMMLCDGWQNAALSKPLKFGTRWETQQWSKVPFGRFVNEGTSVTVLHEAMHCIWIRSTTHGPLTGRLPSGSREVYAWSQINQLQDPDKKKNAHSYALLATTMWLKANRIGPDGKMGYRYRVSSGSSSLQMPNDPHPV